MTYPIIISVKGAAGCGKTTLLVKIIQSLDEFGFKLIAEDLENNQISVVKESK